MCRDKGAIQTASPSPPGVRSLCAEAVNRFLCPVRTPLYPLPVALPLFAFTADSMRSMAMWIAFSTMGKR